MNSLFNTYKKVLFERVLLERLEDTLYFYKGIQFYKNIIKYLNNLNENNLEDYIWFEREGVGRVPFYIEELNISEEEKNKLRWSARRSGGFKFAYKIGASEKGEDKITLIFKDKRGVQGEAYYAPDIQTIVVASSMGAESLEEVKRAVLAPKLKDKIIHEYVHHLDFQGGHIGDEDKKKAVERKTRQDYFENEAEFNAWFVGTVTEALESIENLKKFYKENDIDYSEILESLTEEDFFGYVEEKFSIELPEGEVVELDGQRYLKVGKLYYVLPPNAEKIADGWLLNDFRTLSDSFRKEFEERVHKIFPFLKKVDFDMEKFVEVYDKQKKL